MTQEEEKESKVLFGFLKNNKEWRTSFDEKRKRCIYHNPLNASAYGLLFHQEESWLEAVVNKFEDFITDHHINMSLLVGEIPDGFCFQVYFAEDFDKEPYILYHLHDKDFKKGLRKILVQVIQDCTFKYN